MKAILTSIQSPHTCNILNLIKLLEIRKKFPKDYVGWVYIYCTKSGGMAYKGEDNKYHVEKIKNYFPHYCINGKVVARFWCDKVEQVFWRNPRDDEHIPYLKSCDLLKCACLCQDEFEEYVGDNESYAIHITKLEVFDKPKDIEDFSVVDHEVVGVDILGEKTSFKILRPLTRAPQSWCYVEI